jgi:predicted PP-loop superfamily ATPase
LFQVANDAVLDELRNLDTEAIAAGDALDVLRRLKQRLM